MLPTMIGNSSTTTLSLCSDGLYLYWVTCSTVVVKSGPSSKSSNKSLTIFVDVLEFLEEEGRLVLVPVKDRITVQRKDIEVRIVFSMNWYIHIFPPK